MARIDVDAATIRALGDDLSTLGEILMGLGELGHAHTGDFGHVELTRAVDAVLGNWTLQRNLLARMLEGLGDRAQHAGAVYFLVEEDVAGVFSGAPGAGAGERVLR